MSDIILNAKYAPGIPTYGVPGEDGEKGDNGRSIFYVPIDITNNESDLLNYINANKIYNTNIPYVYSNGDAFVQSDGKIYQYNKNNDVKFEYIDNFNFGVKDIFEKDLSDNFIYNKDQKNIILTDSSNIANSEYLFNVESDDNKFIKLQNGDKSITITYDEDLKGFLFSSKEPIFFDNLYAKNSNNTNEEYDVSPASEDVEEDIITPGDNYIYYEIVGEDNLTIKDLTLPPYLDESNVSFGALRPEEGDYSYIVFTDKITEVPNNFFMNCTKIKKVILPNSIKFIGQSAFANCGNLESINIPVGLTDIGLGAFLGCISLKSIDMPNSVSFLGDSAFFGCTNLEYVNISNKITAIPFYCFYNCRSLKEITLPSSVTTLLDKSLDSGVENIYIKNIERVLACVSDALNNEKINVYVHANIFEEYKNDDFWSKFNILKIDYVDEDIFEEVNNYQPVINYFDVDILNEWKEGEYVNTKIENYINDYVFEASYKSKKTIIDSEASYNSFIEGIKEEKVVEYKINLFITSKKYFVSKYKDITLKTNN